MGTPILQPSFATPAVCGFASRHLYSSLTRLYSCAWIGGDRPWLQLTFQRFVRRQLSTAEHRWRAELWAFMLAENAV